MRWYPTIRIRPGLERDGGGKMYAWTGTEDDPENCALPTPEPEYFPERYEPVLPDTWTRLTNGNAECHPYMSAYSPIVFTPTTWPGNGAPGGDHAWLVVTQRSVTEQPFAWLSNPEDCSQVLPALDRPDEQFTDGTWVLAPFELDAPGGNYLPAPNMYLIGGFEATNGTPGCGSHAPHGCMQYFDAATNSWSYKASMEIPRQDHNAVLLPDGTIFVIGGSKEIDCCQHDPTVPPLGPCTDPYVLPPGVEGKPARECVVKTPELFNPATNNGQGSWRRLAEHVDPRPYHSTALLLPDGRVFVGGGQYTILAQIPEPGEYPPYSPTPTTSIEVFKPPYCFKTRPNIEPLDYDEVTYGREITFDVTGWQTGGESRVMLIRQGSVTHGHEMASRTVHLQVRDVMGGDLHG